MQSRYLLAAVSAASLLAACGGGGDAENLGKVDANPARGALMQDPPLRITSLSAADLTASLQASATGKQLIQVTGAPKCGVDVQYIKYGTVGGANEATDATGVLMTPSGATGCTGARPIVLYAHGTTTVKSYNLANLADNTNAAYGEAIVLAAMYAAQGFIVVAPNYAGYDTSKLSYHPYLNADQQSKDMIDALTASRTALPRLLQPVTDSGKLFITGYSQGGHVAMATHKALQAAGQTVTASAPMSGPYAMAAFSDAVYYGNVNLGATIFTPLLINSYQKAYGNLYTSLTDVYEAGYASGIDTLLPTDTPMNTVIAQGKLPQLHMFSSTPPTAPAGAPAAVQATINASTPPAGNPLAALGFGAGNLVTNAARLGYLMDAMANPDGAVPLTTGALAANPQHPMRKAGKANDMRTWTPRSPVLLCAGKNDPTVFYSINTQLMQGFWSAPSLFAAPAGLVQVLDVDSAITGATDPFALVKGGFAQAKAGVFTAAGGDTAANGGAGTTAVTSAYHGSLVPPFCNVAARGFFQQVLAAGN